MADVYNTYSKNYLASGEFEKAISYSNRALESNYQEPAYHRNKAKVLLATLVLEDNAENRSNLKEEIISDLKKAEKLNVNNLATLRNVIPLYYFLTIENIKRPITDNNIDQMYIPVTANYYRGLKDTYDNDLGIFADVAEYERKLFLTEDFEISLEKVRQLRPEILEWHESFN